MSGRGGLLLWARFFVTRKTQRPPTRERERERRTSRARFMNFNEISHLTPERWNLFRVYPLPFSLSLFYSRTPRFSSLIYALYALLDIPSLVSQLFHESKRASCTIQSYINGILIVSNPSLPPKKRTYL